MTNKELLHTAESNLANAQYPAKKLAFFHAGISVGATLLLAAVTHLLTTSMDKAVGIAGLETRTMLTFIQSLLIFAVTLVLPFWDLGYTRAGVCYAKGETPMPRDLLSGLQKFGPALRLFLLRAFAVGAILSLTMQVSTLLFMLSPFSANILEKVEPILTGATDLTPALMEELMPKFVPLYIMWAVVGIAVFIPIFYRFRLADFALMDGANGALSALLTSARQTKGRCKQLFSLDLHFWWYYFLLALCVGVSYLDILLPRLGIPVNTDIAFWGFTVLGQLSNLAVAVLCAPKVKTAYALFLIDN